MSQKKARKKGEFKQHLELLLGDPLCQLDVSADGLDGGRILRGHRKNCREGGTKKCDRVGGKNKASGRGTTSWDREGLGRGNI